MVSSGEVSDPAEAAADWWHASSSNANIAVALASVTVIVASSTLVLFLCAICRRYSMDFTDYDKDNAQVIYNVSAGAKELPSEYTLGEYRGYPSEYKGAFSAPQHDTVFANPSAHAHANMAYSSPSAMTSQSYAAAASAHSVNNHDDYDDDGSLTYHNAAFMNKSP